MRRLSSVMQMQASSSSSVMNQGSLNYNNKSSSVMMIQGRQLSSSSVMQGTLYNKSSKGQIEAHEVTFPALVVATTNIAKLISERKLKDIEILDFGCASGANAVQYSDRVLNLLRSKYKDYKNDIDSISINSDSSDRIPFNIRYTFSDLPDNDWKVHPTLTLSLTLTLTLTLTQP